MAYTPQEWKPFQEGGTIITADALNYMEQGIADTSADQEALDAWCRQRDVELREQWLGYFDNQTNAFNETMKENYNYLAQWMIDWRDKLQEDAATEHAAIRSEMAALPHIGAAYNTFTWSSDISANTATKLSGGTVSGDGPATLSGQGVQIPATAHAAFLTCQMTLPITASTTGRRFGEVTKDSESSGIRQELYIGNVVGVSLVGVPGSVYYPQAYCGKAGTATAQITVVTLV